MLCLRDPAHSPYASCFLYTSAPAVMEITCKNPSPKFLVLPKIHLATSSKGLACFCWGKPDEDKREGNVVSNLSNRAAKKN